MFFGKFGSSFIINFTLYFLQTFFILIPIFFLSIEEVAKLTLACLKSSVPSEVPGIAFLSGGQSELEATENLNLINKLNKTGFIMSYSYGRALQQGALKFWSKNIKDIEGTQKVFNHRAKMNTLAAQGKWAKEIESQ